MRRMILPGGFSAALLALASIGAAAAHPAEGFEPNALHPAYGTLKLGERVEWSLGDIEFTQPYPDPASLSDIEKYMLEGTRDSWMPDGGLDSWWYQVINAVVTYDKKTGRLPQTITEDVLREIAWDPDIVDARSLEIYSNPITNGQARLDQREFSPGDMFIKRLTDNEVAQLAEVHPPLRNDVAGIVPDPRDGSVSRRIKITSPVYYFRMYGRSGVILSRLYYSFEPL